MRRPEKKLVALTKVMSFKEETGRALVLVDIENVSGAKHSPFQNGEFWRNTLVGHAVPKDKKNDYIVGLSFFNALDAFDLPESVKVVLGDGPDAGELALIDDIDYRDLIVNYDRLVIVSGDRKFIPLAKNAKRFGLEVVLIARSNHSQKLRTESDWLINIKTNAQVYTFAKNYREETIQDQAREKLRGKAEERRERKAKNKTMKQNN